MNETDLLSLSFYVEKLHLAPDVAIGGKITAYAKFLNHNEQQLFEPLIVSSNPLCLNSGRMFTFGISCNKKLELRKEFTVIVNLHQIDPDKQLSEAVVDITEIFRDTFCGEPTPGSTQTQVKTFIRFNNAKGEHMATMDVHIRIIPPGSKLITGVPIDTNVNNQIINTANECYVCPKVSDLKCNDDNEHSDEGEWDMMSAELKNGHSIAIKYKRKYYSFQSTSPDETCPVDEIRPTRSEEKLNSHMLDLLSDMHKLILGNAKKQELAQLKLK